MNKLFIRHISAIAVILAMVACNSSGDEPVNSEFEWTDVAVTAFSLSKNDSILANLDSVFFAIDLENARIYNPDSLPKGTVPNRIVINPVFSTVSKAEIKFKTAEGKDSVRTYTTSDTDSLDFTTGPVILSLTSLDEKVVRDYTISINVHEMDPDSLAWGEMAYAPLPSGLRSQHTVLDGDIPVCFTVSNDGKMKMMRSSKYELSFSESEDMGDLPDNGNVNTLCFLDSEIYMVIGSDLCRYIAPDNWMTLTPMSWIYGEYDGKLFGCRPAGSEYKMCTWPVSDEIDLDPDFPVSGTSNMIVYTSEWSNLPMAIIVGGFSADGSTIAATWAFDGNRWQNIGVQPLPAASGVTLVPYFTYRTSNQWKVTEWTTLFAFGGRKPDATMQSEVYVSYDRGMHWTKGQSLVQLPDYIRPRHSAQAIVMSKNMSVSRSCDAWTNYPLPAIPHWYRAEIPVTGSRVTAPITEWECPYIYLIGGIGVDMRLCPEIWRGVINRLTFVPLY